MSNNCGCNDVSGTTPTENEDYIMVKATEQTADKCGSGNSAAIVPTNCTKSDSTFDRLMADFSFSDIESFVILVCDGSLYAVGQWIQFVIGGASVRILSINGNQLTVSARCINSATVSTNPTNGTIIRKNDLIITIPNPECIPDGERQTKIEEALADAKELELPSLEQELSTTAKMNVVGWKESDSGDSNFRKVLKRIAGVFFLNRIPYLTALPTVKYSDISGYRRIVIRKSDGRIGAQLNASEDTTSAEADNLSYRPLLETIHEFGGTFSDENTWVSIANGSSHSATLNIAVSGLPDDADLPTTFYAVLNIRFGVWNPSAFTAKGILKLDSNVKAVSYGFYNVRDFQSVTVVVPVTKASKTVALELESTSSAGTPKHHCTVELQGIFF